MSNNPFDWQNYKPVISMRDLNVAWRNSYNMARHVDEKRRSGIEPSPPYGNSAGAIPQAYATTTVMPQLKKVKRVRRKK